MKYLSLLCLCSLLISCSHPLKEAKYSAYEAFGIEKRDLFKREISGVKDEQEDTGEAFKDALAKLKEVYDVEGGNLEKQYNKLNDSYKEAKDKVAGVSSRIEKLDTVAQDLFQEWKAEIRTMESDQFKTKSQHQLTDTRSKYRALYEKLKKSEEKTKPILAKLKDQTLFLKHNLNAQSISGLKKETIKIQDDIENLIYEMNASADEANAFIKTL